MLYFRYFRYGEPQKKTGNSVAISPLVVQMRDVCRAMVFLHYIVSLGILTA